MNHRLGVLISGRGSNLQALIDAIQEGRLDATIAVVISNRPAAPGLEIGRRAGINVVCIDHKKAASREDHDRKIVSELLAHDVALVCLAGYMRLVGAPLLDAFPNAILNIHPSLLPAFPGVDAQRQALDHGVKVTGATVHLVTAGLDDGPIVVQRAVPIFEEDTETTLAARILEVEHRAYAEAVSIILEGGWRVEGRRFRKALPNGPASRPPPPADS